MPRDSAPIDAPVIVWLRRALRLADNPVLTEAMTGGATVLPLWLWAPEEDGGWAPAPASRWWLPRSLAAFDADLARAAGMSAGTRALVVRSAAGLGSAGVLRALMDESGARLVLADRLYEPAAIARDAAVADALADAGGELRLTGASLLCEPGEVTGSGGGPMKVFTPFWKRCASLLVPEPLPTPESLRLDRKVSRALTASDVIGDDPGPTRACGLWTPGERGARDRLAAFASEAVRDYAEDRDRPDLVGTSRLSAALHFGELSPRQVLKAVEGLAASGDRGAAAFVRQVYWREFAYHLLANMPDSVDRPLRREFERFPWRDDPEDLAAWQQGRTGYPMVDAGMRELEATGWMHNRARLVAASFLTKDLLIPWQTGARRFWEGLVDADLADNTMGWQWTAGCGADAAPYFRVLNPVLQGERFDPEGAYVRAWVPELTRVPKRFIHRPWDADDATLAEAGVVLGRDYPRPMVDHLESRTRALAAFGAVRG